MAKNQKKFDNFYSLLFEAAPCFLASFRMFSDLENSGTINERKNAICYKEAKSRRNFCQNDYFVKEGKKF